MRRELAATAAAQKGASLFKNWAEKGVDPADADTGRLTHADEGRRMLTYADVCREGRAEIPQLKRRVS
jgi:hypothetical protein